MADRAGKVLVTGGCGFLGSHVCEYYVQQGARVIAYDNMTKHELDRTGFAVEGARNHNAEVLARLGVDVVRGDVRNLEHLLDRSSGCSYLIHTAAQPAMTISWEDPLLDLTTNVDGTVNVLEAARRHRIPAANCATIHVYGNGINASITEGKTRYERSPASVDEAHPTLSGSITPLHASKSAAETYCRAYADTYGVQVASFRLTGIYGTRQFGGEDHGWVANFAIRAVTGRPLNVYGTGKQVRDIIYATDVCRAFDAFFRSRKSGIYNVGGGPGTAISLIECIDLIGEIVGTKPEVRYGADRPGDLRYFVSDVANAKRALGWEPKIAPREGVALLLEWINANRALFGA